MCHIQSWNPVIWVPIVYEIRFYLFPIEVLYLSKKGRPIDYRKLCSTKLDNCRQIKSSLGERRISRIQVQDVQKHALELIEIFSPFLRCGRRQLQG